MDQLQKSFMPILAIILGVFLFHNYLTIFASLADNKHVFSIPLDIEIWQIPAPLFFIITLIGAGIFASIADHYCRKTILVFNAIFLLLLSLCIFIIVERLVPSSIASIIVNVAKFVVFAFYCAELAVSLSYLIETNDNKYRAFSVSFISTVIYLNFFQFLILLSITISLLGVRFLFNRYAINLHKVQLKRVLCFNLLLDIIYALLFLGISIYSQKIIKIIFEDVSIWLFCAILSAILVALRIFCLKKPDRMNKSNLISLDEIAPIGLTQKIKSTLAFIGLAQFLFLLPFFSLTILLYSSNFSQDFMSSVSFGSASLILIFLILSFARRSDFIGRKPVISYSFWVTFIFIVIVCILNLVIPTNSDYSIVIMLYGAWIILAGSVLSTVPLVLLAENCSAKWRGAVIALMIAIFTCGIFLPDWAKYIEFIISLPKTPYWAWGLLLGFLCSLAIAFISSGKMKETAFTNTQNLGKI